MSEANGRSHAQRSEAPFTAVRHNELNAQTARTCPLRAAMRRATRAASLDAPRPVPFIAFYPEGGRAVFLPGTASASEQTRGGKGSRANARQGGSGERIRGPRRRLFVAGVGSDRTATDRPRWAARPRRGKARRDDERTQTARPPRGWLKRGGGRIAPGDWSTGGVGRGFFRPVPEGAPCIGLVYLWLLLFIALPALQSRSRRSSTSASLRRAAGNKYEILRMLQPRASATASARSLSR